MEAVHSDLISATRKQRDRRRSRHDWRSAGGDIYVYWGEEVNNKCV